MPLPIWFLDEPLPQLFNWKWCQYSYTHIGDTYALWSPAVKGLPLGSRLWCLIVKLSLSHWYPGSDVVLNFIDSSSLPSSFTLNYLIAKHYLSNILSTQKKQICPGDLFTQLSDTLSTYMSGVSEAICPYKIVECLMILLTKMIGIFYLHKIHGYFDTFYLH